MVRHQATPKIQECQTSDGCRHVPTRKQVQTETFDVHCSKRIAAKSCENLGSSVLAKLRLEAKHVEIPLCASCPTRAMIGGVATFVQRGPDPLIMLLVDDKRACSKERHCLAITVRLLPWDRDRSHSRLPSKRVRRRDLLLLRRNRRSFQSSLKGSRGCSIELTLLLVNLVAVCVNGHDWRPYKQRLW